MTERKVNLEIMNRIGFTKVEEVEELRKEYKKIVNNDNEKEFFYSVMGWWNDGNAPYYDSYLKKMWVY